MSFKQLSLDTALELAHTTLRNCRENGYQVAVAVVDRMGNLQVNIRDQLAGAHTTETAYRGLPLTFEVVRWKCQN